MITKEECEKALMNICSSNSRIEDRKVFYQLIHEHFDNNLTTTCTDKRVDKKENSSENRQERVIAKIQVNYDKEDIEEIVRGMIENNPLKLDEIKDGMWIWDGITKEWILIQEIDGRQIGALRVGFIMPTYTMYTSGRFYANKEEDHAG